MLFPEQGQRKQNKGGNTQQRQHKGSNREAVYYCNKSWVLSL